MRTWLVHWGVQKYIIYRLQRAWKAQKLEIPVNFSLIQVPVSLEMNYPIFCLKNMYLAPVALGTKVSRRGGGKIQRSYCRFSFSAPIFNITFCNLPFTLQGTSESGASVIQFSLNKFPVSSQIRKREGTWERSNCTSHTHATKFSVFILLTHPCLAWSLVSLISEFSRHCASWTFFLFISHALFRHFLFSAANLHLLFIFQKWVFIVIFCLFLTFFSLCLCGFIPLKNSFPFILG